MHIEHTIKTRKHNYIYTMLMVYLIFLGVLDITKYICIFLIKNIDHIGSQKQ